MCRYHDIPYRHDRQQLCQKDVVQLLLCLYLLGMCISYGWQWMLKLPNQQEWHVTLKQRGWQSAMLLHHRTSISTGTNNHIESWHSKLKIYAVGKPSSLAIQRAYPPGPTTTSMEGWHIKLKNFVVASIWQSQSQYLGECRDLQQGGSNNQSHPLLNCNCHQEHVPL